MHTSSNPLNLAEASGVISDPLTFDSSSGFMDVDYNLSPELSNPVTEAYRFESHFEDCMEMNAPAKEVADYLDVHQEWFRRCAHPMTVELISQNGYALSLGRFGALGYDIEPKIGLDLLPQDHGVYRINTIPVPNYHSHGYEVDFRASLELREVTLDQVPEADRMAAIDQMTRVEWVLDLAVTIHFPKFIHALPKSLIQTTGEQVLHQIVKQISRRLTYKVQEDFHHNRSLPMPKRARKRKA